MNNRRHPRGSGLYLPGLGCQTGRKKEIVDRITGEYAQPFAKIEKALAATGLTEEQRQTLEQIRADLVAEVRQRILVALQDLD